MEINDLNFAEIDALKERIDSHKPLTTSLRKNLLDNLVIDWTYNSNAIEGNSLTLSETKVVLEYGITVNGKALKDHLEAVDHKEAIYLLLDLAKKKTPLTEFDIRSLHHLILKGIDDKNAGTYRKEQVIITGARHIPPSYVQVPELMERLVDDFNGKWKKYHPIIRASLLSGEFVKIHPFVDGNGRTSRLLLNLSLIKDGYSPIVIKNKDRLRYIEVLDKALFENAYSQYIKFVAEYEKDKEKWLLSNVLERQPEL